MKRKIVSAILFSSLALALFGCSKGGDNAADTSEATAESESKESETETDSGVIQGLIETEGEASDD